MTVYYAIGDIHGEITKLNILHSRIERTHEIDFPGQTYSLVHLGDYVDRGPDSFEVINKLIKLENGSPNQLINLKGNHEAMMLDAYFDDQNGSYDFWVKHGGDKTIRSYRMAGFDRPPEPHFSWIRKLKTFHWDRDAQLIFVHAGIVPSKFPNDGAEVHMWSRSRQFFDLEDWGDDLPIGTRVVHGHTPTQNGKPEIKGNYTRINIDTGACYGEELTAAVFAPGDVPRFITS